MYRVRELIERFVYHPLFIPAYELNECQLIARNTILGKIHKNIYSYVTVPCPCCKSHSSTVIATRDCYSIPSVFSVCEACGLFYTSTRFSNESLSTLYGHDYRLLDRGVDQPSFEFYRFQLKKGEEINRYCQKYLGGLPSETLIIEIGVGAGGILGYFYGQGYEVYGVDLDPSYIDLGKKILGDRLVLGTVDAILEKISSVRKGRPILVIYEQVLEHLEDPCEELKKVKNLINPEYLYISVPGIRNIRNHYSGGLQRYLQFVHLIHFELKTLNAVLHRVGYELISGSEEIRALYKLSTKVSVPLGDIEDGAREIQKFLARLPGRSYGIVGAVRFQTKLMIKKILRILNPTSYIRSLRWIAFRIINHHFFYSPGKSGDRRFLEGTILREIYCGRYKNVAFVGVHPQSSWYGYISLLRKNLNFDYIDPYAENAPKFGLLYKVRLQDFGNDINFYGRYDCIIINGVFGYGIDSLDEKKESFSAMDKILDVGGVLIVGYRSNESICDINLDLVPRNFLPCNIPGTLMHKIGGLHSNGHSYAAFQKASN